MDTVKRRLLQQLPCIVDQYRRRAPGGETANLIYQPEFFLMAEPVRPVVPDLQEVYATLQCLLQSLQKFRPLQRRVDDQIDPCWPLSFLMSCLLRFCHGSARSYLSYRLRIRSTPPLVQCSVKRRPVGVFAVKGEGIFDTFFNQQEALTLWRQASHDGGRNALSLETFDQLILITGADCHDHRTCAD